MDMDTSAAQIGAPLHHTLEALAPAAFVVGVPESGEPHYIAHNARHAALTGRVGEGVKGVTPHQVLPDDQAAELAAACRRAAALAEPLERDLDLSFAGNPERTWRLSIQPLDGADPTLARLCGVLVDVTEGHQARARLQWLASFDPLTDMPNRDLFVSRLGQSLVRARRRNGQGIGVMAVNVDRFREVNSSLGYHAGDTLLAALGRRLTEALLGAELVARVGGDEFAVILPTDDGVSEASRLCDRVFKAMDAPFDVLGHVLPVEVSVGLARFPEDSDTASDLLKKAEVALHRAKADGAGGFQYYSPEFDRAVHERLQLAQALKEALASGELSLHFQPQVTLTDGRLTGAEALVRWYRPDGTVVPPNLFVPVAEQTGLILDLGAWVLDRAVARVRGWLDRGLDPGRVAVNVSPRQFRKGDVPGLVAAALDRHDVPAGHLEVEVTEGVVMNDAAGTVETLERLRALGVEVVLDDFGTGYSSLAYLARFPIGRLKVDRSFLHQAPGSARDTALVHSIVALGRTLDLAVLGEGVENEAHLRLLREAGCHDAQGFLFGHPVPAAELETLLAADRNLLPESVKNLNTDPLAGGHPGA